MKRQELVKMNLEVFSEKLDNGLEVYIVPIKNKHNIYATFSTKFGSTTNEFVPIGEKKLIRVPDGVAHFLEHKMFEQKDGVDPFTFFGENGADANANTSYDKTTYLFSGLKNFKENLCFLLDYVQEPYFTDKNVEKEKGIIDQERSMYQDDPFFRMYEGSLNNLIHNHPIKYPIVGTHESIYAITKEDLYKCYNTFYHPSNMFVVITGNVDYLDTLNIIKENQKSKNFENFSKIEVKKYKEEKSVVTKKQEIEMDISIPKVSLSYKIYIKDLSYNLYEINNYIIYYLDIKLGITSKLVENLKRDGLIFEELGLEINNIDDYLLINIFAETRDPDKLVSIIDSELCNKNVLEEDFERKKKCSISAILTSSDSIYRINNKIMGNIIKYGKVIYNDYDLINNFKYEKMVDIINSISFSENTVYIINPKNK